MQPAPEQPQHVPLSPSVVPHPQSAVPQSQSVVPHAWQAQLVLVQSATIKEQYDGLTSRVLGVIQVTGGVLAVVSQAILTGLGSASMYAGSGFWAGIVVSDKEKCSLSRRHKLKYIYS